MSLAGVLILGIAGIVGLSIIFVNARFGYRCGARAFDQVNERLQRNEAQLHAVVRDAADVMVVLDHDDYVVSASPAALLLFGAAVVTATGADLFAAAHPDDRDTAFA